jgi:hypothetical protein
MEIPFLPSVLHPLYLLPEPAIEAHPEYVGGDLLRHPALANRFLYIAASKSRTAAYARSRGASPTIL